MLFAFFIYSAERAAVRNVAEPANCTATLFPTHDELCVKTLAAHYGNVSLLERKPLCETNPAGDLVALCDGYEEEMASLLYNSQLQEHGIAPWEPQAPITPKGSLRIRTLSAVSQVTLVCDGAVIPAVLENSALLLSAMPSGICVLIGTTPEGSITSAPFQAAAPVLGET